MSMQIKASKAQGDPGLFGDILGKVTGIAASFVPGPVGGLVRGLQQKIFPSRQPTSSSLPVPAPRAAPQLDLPGPGGGWKPSVGITSPRQSPSNAFAGGTQLIRQEQMWTDTTPAIGCPKGFKPNKSGYYRRIRTPGNPQGIVSYIEPGSRCVKIRRRNPANPRAADRAVSRIESAKRFAKRMGRVTIRKKCDSK